MLYLILSVQSIDFYRFCIENKKKKTKTITLKKISIIEFARAIDFEQFFSLTDE